MHPHNNTTTTTTTTTTTHIIMADLIVDFPHKRNRHRSVRFAETTTSQCNVKHYEGYNSDSENSSTCSSELWYTKAEYEAMRLAVKEDVLEVRSKAATGSPFNYAGNDDGASATESSGCCCCIGIEHLLTPACLLEVKRCRARCVYTVLSVQARSKDLPSSDSEIDIALASIAQTRRVTLRARSLGKLHQDSI
jgi:hypothetical protein